MQIICSFVSDIYMLADLLTQEDDTRILRWKDYIQYSKANSYRSLQLIVETSVILQNKKMNVKVEIRFRTLSMELWASLEHRIRYKTKLPGSHAIDEELLAGARLAQNWRVGWKSSQLKLISIVKNDRFSIRQVFYV